MTGRTSTDDTTIRHQQKRDQNEADAHAEAERARAGLVGTRGLGAIFETEEKSDTEKALERATEERGVKPGRGEKTG